MNCSELQQLLSVYYDGELQENVRTEVSLHLSECSQCASELAGFQYLSSLADGLKTLVPPGNLWNQLEQQLDQHTETMAPTPQSSQTSRYILALAASLLLVIGISYVANLRSSHHHEEAEFTAEFNQYLVEFQRDPDAAQKFLQTKYKHKKVDPAGNIEPISYRPVMADRLPEHYTAQATYVFDMPCCTCVQSLCRREDGTKLAVFEHDDKETAYWFGDRPKLQVECHGKTCCLVEFEEQLAASWEHEGRYVSVIGVRDIAEVNELVGWTKSLETTRKQ